MFIRSWKIRHLLLSFLIATSASAAAMPLESVLISEALYDPGGADDGREWVELYNPSPGSVDLTGWELRYGGADYGYGRLPLTGTIDAGGYLVVGGPLGDLALDFSPDLQNSGRVADGIALFAADDESGIAGSLLVDAVVYGERNTNSLPRTGHSGETDVGDVPAGHSIARFEGGWRELSEPTPGSGPFARTSDPAALPARGTFITVAFAVLAVILANAGRRSPAAAAIRGTRA